MPEKEIQGCLLEKISASLQALKDLPSSKCSVESTLATERLLREAQEEMSVPEWRIFMLAANYFFTQKIPDLVMIVSSSEEPELSPSQRQFRDKYPNLRVIKT